ncbi:MAG: dihydropyrimidine dehydrogenase, partial [Candidatus Omnitrophica bacterium]|nr:dihydropyrimidine dehydrogenase [Candidatus Omnitrophota bacterium]
MAQPNVKTQPGEKRRNNFNEVSFGYTKKITAEESKRCPQCSDPVCMQGCPLGINIPGFIRQLRENNISGAYQTVKDKNPLPSICGRICSAPCEAA